MTLKMLKRYWSLRQKLKSGNHVAAPADSVSITFIITGLLIYKYFIVYILFYFILFYWGNRMNKEFRGI